MLFSILILLSVLPVAKLTVLSVKSVTLNPATVTGGAIVNGVVTISAAPTEAVTVKITSSSPQIAEVPGSVSIQPGATSAAFIVQTHPVSMNPNVVASPPSPQISAQIGSTAPATATLTVAPPTLTSVTLNPATVGGGSNSIGTVTISGPAPAGGMTITLSTPSAASPRGGPLVTRFDQVRISVPPQVTIPAGATSATFTLATRPVSASTTYEVDAKWGVWVTKTATLTVTTPELATMEAYGQGGYNTYGAEVLGGTAIQGRVTLTGPAEGSPIAVSLKTDIASGGTTGTFAQCGPLPSVPATVTVPVKASSANFTVTTSAGYGVYWVTATLGSKSAHLAITVDSAFFKPVVPSSVKGGTPAQGTLQLTGPAVPASCGNRYVLKSSNTSYAQVPDYVDVPTGTTTATFPITTTALPASAAPVTVTISATGIVINNNVAAPASAHQQTYSANMTITP